MGLLSKIKDAFGGQQVTYELPETPPTVRWPCGEYAGFTIEQEGAKYPVSFAGVSGSERDEAAPEMARILRDAGFKARGARDGSGYPYVNVTDG